VAFGGTAISEGAAEETLGRLHELSADLRGAALCAPDGSLIAAIGPDDPDGPAWERAVRELWEAADGATGDSGARTVHVGTEEGEVFGVRADHASIVATADRFALASLMLCDLRAVLRDLSEPGGEG
jgi:hypothetical protein